MFVTKEGNMIYGIHLERMVEYKSMKRRMSYFIGKIVMVGKLIHNVNSLYNFNYFNKWEIYYLKNVKIKK